MEFVDLLVHNCCGRHALAVFKKAMFSHKTPTKLPEGAIAWRLP